MKVDIISPNGNRIGIKSAKNIRANTIYGIERSLFFVGKDHMQEFNKQVLAKNKTGRIYIRRIKGGSRRRHQASAAGETPANRTGVYRRSVGIKVSGNELAFGNSAPYSLFLEVGTIRMRKRPGLGNSVHAQERNTIRTLAQGINREI